MLMSEKKERADAWASKTEKESIDRFQNDPRRMASKEYEKKNTPAHLRPS